MTYRIHTASTELVAIQFDTIEAIDRELGYEHTEDEREDTVLILNDMGNQEAWVLTGSEDEWRAFAERLLDQINRVSAS